MQSKIILFRTIEPMLRFINASVIKNSQNSLVQVVIDTIQIGDWFDIQTQIWHDLNFPDQISAHSQSIRHINWDAFMEWLGDLSWLEQKTEVKEIASESRQPVTLVIKHPSILFEENPVQFAFFVDVCFHAMIRHEVEGRVFTLILGPIEGNKQLGAFLMTLKAQERYLLLEQDTPN